MSEKKFIKGLFVKSPHANAPDFVLAKMSIKREDLIAELQGMVEDWINLDIKKSKEGEIYAAIDNWKPDGKKAESPTKEDDQDLPF